MDWNHEALENRSHLTGPPNPRAGTCQERFGAEDPALVKPKNGHWRVNARHGYPSVSKAFPIAPPDQWKKKEKKSENAKSKGGGEGGTSKPCHLALQRAGLN